jgi:hypothetical protein
MATIVHRDAGCRSRLAFINTTSPSTELLRVPNQYVVETAEGGRRCLFEVSYLYALQRLVEEGHARSILEAGHEVLHFVTSRSD